jgi:hypothetical protein
LVCSGGGREGINIEACGERGLVGRCGARIGEVAFVYGVGFGERGVHGRDGSDEFSRAAAIQEAVGGARASHFLLFCTFFRRARIASVFSRTWLALVVLSQVHLKKVFPKLVIVYIS